jgi:glycosyltransferase involved in cell wall biosynthesis
MKKTIILIRNAKSYDFGGGERFPVFLADILRDSGYSPIIISRSSKLRQLATSYNVETIKGWWWSQQSWNGKFALLFPIYIAWQCILFFWYLQLFIRIRPVAIHIQSKDDFIAASFAGALLGKRIIWTDHADLKHIWLNTRVWYKNPSGKLVYLAASLADIITVVSKSESNFIAKQIGKDSRIYRKIKTIYNGVVDAKLTPIGHDGRIVFCVASRLVKDKGIGEIIDAFVRIEKEHPDTELILLGDGPDSSTFKELSKHQSKIRFMGHQKNPLQYIVNADIFVHPTYHEGFSVALVEASMLARPIIATSVGGNVEIINDNITGLLVEPKDSDSLYKAMLRLLEDAKLREMLGRNARKQYEKRFNFINIVRDEFIPMYKGDEE